MKLLEQMQQKIKMQGLSPKTFETYAQHCKDFFRFLLKRFGEWKHPKDVGPIQEGRKMFDKAETGGKIWAFCLRGLAFSASIIKALKSPSALHPSWVRVRWGLRARLVLDPVTLTAVHKPAWISVQRKEFIKEMEGHYVHNAG